MATSAYRVTFLHRLAGFIGASYLGLVGRTSAIQRWDHPAAVDLFRGRKKMIYGFWHRHQAFLAWQHRGEGVSILVSLSKDGESIAQVMNRVGLKAVRGSTSRGAEAAFRQMVDVLEAGGQV